MIRYNVNTGVEKIKSKYRKYAITAGAGVLIAGAAAVPTLAAGTGCNDSNGSACGQAHAARADVYGNYGFLGQAGGTPGYHNGATGQDAGATGSNNSHTGCQEQL
jgi:hypothetical protein